MSLVFTALAGQQPGSIARLLKQSYAGLVSSDPVLWEPEARAWEQYDQEVFQHPDTVGACLFFSRHNDAVVGFASWDPRQAPRQGIMGHNCILPECRGQGFGKRQLEEVVRRFVSLGIQTARATSNDHPFFAPARRMYLACGFGEVGRVPWGRDPDLMLIEYEKELD